MRNFWTVAAIAGIFCATGCSFAQASTVLSGQLTATAATTQTIAIAGVTASSKCVYSAGNSIAARDLNRPIAELTNAPFVIAAPDSVTLTFAATPSAGGVWNVLCSAN